MTVIRQRTIFTTLLTGSLVAATCLLVRAQQPATGVPTPAAAMTAGLQDTIPVDAQITTGRFPNGLRYYIRANKKPEGRAELRLAVNAGSVLEEDDQRGLAHFVEHMAFNGTKNFPKMDIVNFMESIGMRFGNDVNAYTSFDETVYQLQVPTDRPAVLDRAMLILEDWAHNVTFDPTEIDKERGVIMEEWRLGRGAEARMQDKQFPILLQGSRYADRMPIGTPEILQNFKHDRLRQFYADWYRPDLMAVVAVGDFDKAAVESMIRNHFANLPAAVNPKPRPKYDVPPHTGTRYAIATDREASQTRVTVYSTMPARDQTTIASYRQQQIIDRLFTGMLNARLGDMADNPGAPFLAAGAGRGPLVRTAEASSLIALVKDDGIEAGLESVFTEAARVARFGFTQTEFDRMKVDMLRAIERAIVEKDNQVSSSLAAEYIRNFTTDEPIPGIVYEEALYKRFIPGIALSEVNALARDWAPDNNRIVLVNAPERPGYTVPTQNRLAAVMAGIASKPLTAYAEAVDAQPLLDRSPTPGRIVSTSTRPEFGITEWTLSNGVHVVLKPTTFKQDEVVFRAFSPGGTSLASDQDFIAADTAAQVVAAGGLGRLSATDLRKVMAGKVANAGVTIGDYWEELNGGGSVQDLETLFQVIYMRFTQPRPDPSIFSVMVDQTKIALANQQNTPDFAFQSALSSALWQNHPRAQPLTAEGVNQMNLEKSLAFYKARLSDASDFTFVFVGSFEPATLKPFVERYLATLPSTNRKETWRDVGIRPATGVINRRVVKGIDPKSQTSILFTGPFQYDPPHRVTIRTMAMVLDGLLRNLLREELGGTYGVSVQANYTKVPQPRYTMSISFGSDPARTDALVAGVFSKIEELKQTGPSRQDLTSIREILMREFESNSKQNNFLLREITARYQNGEDLKDFFGLPALYANINADDVQRAAQEYLNTDNYVKVELFPETQPATADANRVSASPVNR